MEKYTYIRKTITWDSRRYEVRGKTEQEACEKLADLVVSLKRGEFAASGQTTVEQWFQQWMQTYKIPSGITPKSLRLYDEKYNGYIGPAIGQCCFETDGDVPEALRRALGCEAEPFMTWNGRKWHIDLKAVNALWLQKAGVQHIDICEDCTCCRTDLYWSHRKTGLQRGEQAALIALREVTP